jgi:hypothetical protein
MHRHALIIAHIPREFPSRRLYEIVKIQGRFCDRFSATNST